MIYNIYYDKHREYSKCNLNNNNYGHIYIYTHDNFFIILLCNFCPLSLCFMLPQTSNLFLKGQMN